MLQDSSSVICDDDFTSTRLNLSLISLHLLFYRGQRRTILSIPFGPKLVRTASDTANHQLPFTSQEEEHTFSGIHIR